MTDKIIKDGVDVSECKYLQLLDQEAETLKAGGIIETLTKENEELKETANKLLDERNKYLDNWGINLIYKQTLTEIKEHFDEECKLCKAHYVNITDEICKECEIKDMLQKISECEVE